MIRANRKRGLCSDSDDESSGTLQLQQALDERRAAGSSLHQDAGSSDGDRILDFDEDLKVALDIGTTFATVAYVARGFDSENEDIPTLGDFPSDSKAADLARQIPTESYYPIGGHDIISAIIEDAEHAACPEEPIISSIPDCIFQFDDVEETVAPNNDELISPGYLHGWEVQDHLGTLDSEVHRDSFDGRVSRMKLLLDDSPVTAPLRKELEYLTQKLVNENVIKKREDVITHYLTVLLDHLKRFLQIHHDFKSHHKVEFVISVPVCWSTKANNIMSECTIEAIRRVGFGNHGSRGVPRIFFVNESEAAATYALQSGLYSLRRREIFLLVDAGGGTVDVGCYSVAEDFPLRLKQEINKPEADLCGSSYVNQRFATMLYDDLRNAGYLDRYRDTIRFIAEKYIIPDFENRVKRKANFANKGARYLCDAPGLMPCSTNRRLRKNAYVLNHDEMKSLFEDSFYRTANLIRRQIAGAKAKECKIDKVLVVGGFSDSPAFRAYLRSMFEETGNSEEPLVRLILPKYNRITQGFECATGVAKGAILRSLDKSQGPLRIPKLSYGILTHYPITPALKQVPQFKRPIAEGVKEIVDYEQYLVDTIDWVIKAGVGPLPSRHHVFIEKNLIWPDKTLEWIHNEDLYASESCTESRFHVDHPFNKGRYHKIGRIILNLNGLKQHVKSRKRQRKRRYVMRVLLEIEMIDRNLSFFVHWPAKRSASALPSSQNTFSVAAAFEPGTD